MNSDGRGITRQGIENRPGFIERVSKILVFRTARGQLFHDRLCLLEVFARLLRAMQISLCSACIDERLVVVDFICLRVRIVYRHVAVHGVGAPLKLESFLR